MMRTTMRTRMTVAVVVMMMWYCDRPASGVMLFVGDC